MASVTVQKWGSGKDDCLERILTGQGYSLQEIYAKGADGKSFMQTVAAQNNLRDPNLLRPGQSLTIPKKGETQAATSEGIASGEASVAATKTADGTRSAEVTIERREDGGATSSTQVNNGGASIQHQTDVAEGGRIDAKVSARGDVVNTREVATNSNGSARTVTTTEAGPKGTTTEIRDGDKSTNMTVEVTEGGRIVTDNPAVAGEDGVQTLTERKMGWGERIGSWGDNFGRWVIGEKRDSESISVVNARSATQQRNADGSATTKVVDSQGEVHTHTSGADGWMQRSGRWVDETASSIGSWFSRNIWGTSPAPAPENGGAVSSEPTLGHGA
jgi:hypothetical protein